MAIAAIAVVVVAKSLGLPVWGSVVAAVTVGDAIASVLYATTPTAFGRAIGSLVGLGTFLFLVLAAPGAWIALAAAAVVVAVVLFIRYKGTRHVDRVTRDRTVVPFLFDDGNRLVDSIDAVWGSTRPNGPRQGLRAAHSHGSVVRGTWKVDPAGAGQAECLLGGSAGEVIARFSNFPGLVARADQRHTTHGLALTLTAPPPVAGEEVDPCCRWEGAAGFTMVLVDIRRFPVETRDDFVTFAQLLGVRGWRKYPGFAWLIITGRTTLHALLGTFRFLRVYSYAERTYYGLNSFWWTPLPDGSDKIPIRYLATPVKPGVAPTIPPPAVAVPQTRLDGELQARLGAKVPVEFKLEMVLGLNKHGASLSEDRVRDPTRRWPRRHRKTQPLCTVTLDRYDPLPRDDLLFQPFDVPERIRASDDEILSARRTAYATSFLRRCPLDGNGT